MRFKTLLVSLFSFALLGVALSEAAEPRRGGTLRFGIRKNLETLNPFVRMQSINHRIRSLVYENLLAVDRNLDPVPAVATSWVITPDAMTYTFQLRPGVKFHNGKPLSPSDIKWSIEYTQNPKNRAFGQADATIIEKIELLEPDRIRVRLKAPMAPFLSAVAGIHLFPIVAKDSLETGEARQDTLPPGTGPFRFAEWKPAQEIRLSRHESYWQKGLPYLNDVRFILAPNETVRMNAVRAGDLEIAEEISGEQIHRIREGKIPGVKLAIASAGTVRRIGINHCRPPFNNLKVRQALAYALDKQEIIDGAYSGLGTSTGQRILKTSKWFIPEFADRKQDLAKARALLAEAGYPKGFKATYDATPGMEMELQVIQAQAKKVGIDLETMTYDAASRAAAHERGEYQLVAIGGNTASDPDLAYYGYYHTPPPHRWGKGGRVQPCYSSARVDELLDNARKIADFQERRRMYKEVMEILREEVADIPLAFTENGFALQSQVQDFEPTITSTFSYGNGGLVKTWMEK
jgi:ABC-type transport system substrate-binding protein